MAYKFFTPNLIYIIEVQQSCLHCNHRLNPVIFKWQPFVTQFCICLVILKGAHLYINPVTLRKV